MAKHSIAIAKENSNCYQEGTRNICDYGLKSNAIVNEVRCRNKMGKAQGKDKGCLLAQVFPHPDAGLVLFCLYFYQHIAGRRKECPWWLNPLIRPWPPWYRTTLPVQVHTLVFCSPARYKWHGNYPSYTHQQSHSLDVE